MFRRQFCREAVQHTGNRRALHKALQNGVVGSNTVEFVIIGERGIAFDKGGGVLREFEMG